MRTRGPAGSRCWARSPGMLPARQGQGKAYGNVSDTVQLFTTHRFTDEETRLGEDTAGIPH